MIINIINSHSPLLYLTQSLWRDEAFSVLMSEPPVAKIISLAVQDFNPPLYYIILHFWMRIFGNGEIGIRMLSFIFHLGLVYVCYRCAKALKFSNFFIFYFLFFIFFNPMLIYFAFEARMYSLFALLATASMYFFLTKNWVLYVLTSALGLWTQPFMIFVILSQGVYLIFTRTLKKIHIVSFILIFLLFSPWIPVILSQFSRSGPMWIWPINWTTVTTILGNLFTGYEGTPGGLWNKMKILSGIILFFGFLILKETLKLRRRQHADFYQLLLLWLFLPVIFVLIISYFKPIYVNRYLIFTTVAEVFLIVIGMSNIKNRTLQAVFLFSFFIFIFYFNLWFPARHQKQDIRSTIQEIEKLAKPGDLIFSQTPLTFFEAAYYFPDRSRVFLYKPPERLSSGAGVPASNPNQPEIPFYLGAVIIPKEKWRGSFPTYPGRAFLIHDDGSFEVISQR